MPLTASGGCGRRLARLALALACASAPGWAGPARHDLRELPLRFEPNRGQAHPAAEFVARGDGYFLFLARTEVVLSLGGPPAPSAGGGAAAVRMHFSGGRGDSPLVGEEELPGRTHYLLGNDPTRWRTGIAGFRRVRYPDVYPGVDLVLYGNGRDLEYDFEVAPGADPSLISVRFEGARSIERDRDGDLGIVAGSRELRLRRPAVYQGPRGARTEVSGGYVVGADGEVRFRLGDYDRARPLVIDPVVSYASYLGGGAHDLAQEIAVDRAGNVILVGQTASPDFPLTGSFSSPAGPSYAAYVVKLNPTGSEMIFATLLGGSAGLAPFDQMDVDVDSAGNVYVTGETDAADFPVVNAIQPRSLGGIDAFVCKLDPSGSSLLYSTYLGGSGDDYGRGISVDPNDSATLVGITNSANFPTASAFQRTRGGQYDAFVARLSPSGSTLLFSTYLGGADQEFGYDVATDLSGGVYVTGLTRSGDFPTTSGALRRQRSGVGDAFVSKLSSQGGIVFSTYLGGSGEEEGLGIEVDRERSSYVAGWTTSADFPTAGAAQSANRGGTDAFLVKLAPGGNSLAYGTYLGGGGTDYAYAVVLDPSRAAHVAGSTASPDFPTLAALQGALRGPSDGFVAGFPPAGAPLAYSTYLGGSGDENPFGASQGIALDRAGNLHLTATTASPDYPLRSPLQAAHGGGLDGAVARIALEPQVMLRAREAAGVVEAVIALSNGASAPREVELKVWIASAQSGEELALVAAPMILALPALLPSAQLTISVPVPSDPRQVRIGARLLQPASGRILSESACPGVPCN